MYRRSLRGGGEKDDELFATEAGGKIALDAEAFEQEMGGAFENLIAVEMAVGVVDALEVVEIDEDE